MRTRASATDARTRGRAAAWLAAAALALVVSYAAPAAAARPHLAFAVIGNTLRTSADETATRRLLDAIALDGQIAFVAYDGNLKGSAENCSDSLYAQRQQLLDTSPLPLIVVPGEHDWSACGSARAGGYDVTERLDLLRQTLFGNNVSLGQTSLPLKRESEVARFRAYRENVRWEFDDTVFVGLNVVGGNNHYSTAGGRNGEYDDRAIATSFWLEHSAEYARRRNAGALVVFVEADPEFERYERPERFAWLRLGSGRTRDGYLEFKRSLVKAARTFRGPLIVIHAAHTSLPRGFAIDQPLFDDKGARMTNVTRIAIAPRERDLQWVRIDVNFAKAPPFHVSVRRIPPNVTASTPQPAQALPPGATSAASGSIPGLMPAPAPSSLPSYFPASEIPASEPPLLPESRTAPAPAPAVPPRPASVQGGS
ncbi:hypothetical protein WKR88_19045 [Trinickia caryophylli]|nr:hypothetical protein [Trinickia caryophylli]WQE12331.1 hypothetical protein U0034_02605 [Trinickia caryophylli]GLU31522.1 hypothetical protein Busp01_13640 [Trinickia caryophylli]